MEKLEDLVSIAQICTTITPEIGLRVHRTLCMWLSSEREILARQAIMDWMVLERCLIERRPGNHYTERRQAITSFRLLYGEAPAKSDADASRSKPLG